MIGRLNAISAEINVKARFLEAVDATDQNLFLVVVVQLLLGHEYRQTSVLGLTHNLNQGLSAEDDGTVNGVTGSGEGGGYEVGGGFRLAGSRGAPVDGVAGIEANGFGHLDNQEVAPDTDIAPKQLGVLGRISAGQGVALEGPEVGGIEEGVVLKRRDKPYPQRFIVSHGIALELTGGDRQGAFFEDRVHMIHERVVHGVGGGDTDLRAGGVDGLNVVAGCEIVAVLGRGLDGIDHHGREFGMRGKGYNPFLIDMEATCAGQVNHLGLIVKPGEQPFTLRTGESSQVMHGALLGTGISRINGETNLIDAGRVVLQFHLDTATFGILSADERDHVDRVNEIESDFLACLPGEIHAAHNRVISRGLHLQLLLGVGLGGEFARHFIEGGLLVHGSGEQAERLPRDCYGVAKRESSHADHL